MPNDVTTRCFVTGPDADVARFRASHFIDKMTEPGEFASDERRASFVSEPYIEFDFNTIITRPAELKGTVAGGYADQGAHLILIRARHSYGFFGSEGLDDRLYRALRAEFAEPMPLYKAADAFLSAHPEYLEEGIAQLRAVAATGYASWHPWSVDKWGTKWESYQLSIVDDAPLQFVFKTAWRFPTPIFEKLAADYPAMTFMCATYDEGDQFAGAGFFNGPADEAFRIGEATPELYKLVYGREPEANEDCEAS